MVTYPLLRGLQSCMASSRCIRRDAKKLNSQGLYIFVNHDGPCILIEGPLAGLHHFAPESKQPCVHPEGDQHPVQHVCRESHPIGREEHTCVCLSCGLNDTYRAPEPPPPLLGEGFFDAWDDDARHEDYTNRHRPA